MKTCMRISKISGRKISLRRGLPIAGFALALAACGGGGGGSSNQAPPGGNTPPPAANTAPTISSLSPDESLAQDSSSEPIAFSVGDAESSGAGVTVTAESSNPELISAEGILVAGNDDSRSLMLTPTEGAAGAATITITATDSAGLSTRQALDVSVTSEQRSFREMVGTAFGQSADAQGESIVGYSWVDNPVDDPTAFDHLFDE